MAPGNSLASQPSQNKKLQFSEKQVRAQISLCAYNMERWGRRERSHTCAPQTLQTQIKNLVLDGGGTW